MSYEQIISHIREKEQIRRAQIARTAKYYDSLIVVTLTDYDVEIKCGTSYRVRRGHNKDRAKEIYAEECAIAGTRLAK